MLLEQIVFLVLAIVATACALGVVIMKDPVHSALMLVATLFNIAGVYILLGAEFIAAIQVLVYAGAIVVLFLFVMMLLQVRPGPSLNRLRFFQSRFAPLLALAFLVEVVIVVLGSSFALNGGRILDPANTQAANIQAGARYSVETDVPYAYPNQATVGGSGIGLRNPDGTQEIVTSGHTALLGKELYSTYLFPFEIASLILLIAAIGAIVIARRSLEHDTGEDGATSIGRGISLAGAMPGSPQEHELEAVAGATKGAKTSEDRRIVLNKK